TYPCKTARCEGTHYVAAPANRERRCAAAEETELASCVSSFCGGVANPNDVLAPIHILQPKRRDFSGSEAVLGKQHHNRVIASSFCCTVLPRRCPNLFD